MHPEMLTSRFFRLWRPAVLLLIFFSAISFAQLPNDYCSDINILRFADHLFKESDYLRASMEYKRLENSPLWGDSLLMRWGLALMNTGRFEEAGYRFRSVSGREYEPHADYYYRYGNLLSPGSMPPPRGLSEYELSDQPVFLRLKYLTLLILVRDTEIPENPGVFNEENQKRLVKIYKHNKSPDYKSPLAAALFSAVVPGSGKIYTGFYSDGFVSLLMTGLMAYLSYDNFKSENNIRGWIFGGVAAFFYGGNVYGSWASAVVYNRNSDEQIKRIIDDLLYSDEIRNPEGLEIIR